MTRTNDVHHAKRGQIAKHLANDQSLVLITPNKRRARTPLMFADTLRFGLFTVTEHTPVDRLEALARIDTSALANPQSCGN